MNKIWKFTLSITDEQWITMPAGAKILSVQMQGYQLTIWAGVDLMSAPEFVPFYIVGTGNPADHVVDKTYLGTVQQHYDATGLKLPGNGMVWHVFTR
jgi:hypothetical protein